MDKNAKNAVRRIDMATLAEQQELEKKMADLVAKWKDVPEAPKYSPGWFKRRADRSLWIMYASKLKKMTKGQQTLSAQNSDWWNP